MAVRESVINAVSTATGAISASRVRQFLSGGVPAGNLTVRVRDEDEFDKRVADPQRPRTCSNRRARRVPDAELHGRVVLQRASAGGIGSMIAFRPSRA
jgi:hypothetical protein